ncbi:MAG: DUF2235 domain-containing protein [Candidatus Thiodiazotropha taylori]
MALYAFDGTWNSDEDEPIVDTNVVRFAELYKGRQVEYIAGVGTRFGKIGALFGGLFGSGGKTRIEEMYDELCDNWQSGDTEIDIIGFSRGAALAVHFANLIGEQGILLADGNFDKSTRVRFLGIWDMVGSFGLSFNTFIDFQSIDLGWNLRTLDVCVNRCFHAMALDERRETFNVVRLDPGCSQPNVHEVWFRGVHSDVGGGNGEIARSNIALQWMIEQAKACGLEFHDEKASAKRYSVTNRFAPIYQNKDIHLDPRRKVGADDNIHPTALAIDLHVGESHQCMVSAKLLYNWTGVKVNKNGTYVCEVIDVNGWKDGDVECGPDGWQSNELPWYQEGIVELAERLRREPDANWFALIAALGDEDDCLIYIGDQKAPFQPSKSADLYLFANDMRSKYGNNSGFLRVKITRTE